MKPDMRDLLPMLRAIGFGTWDPLGLADAVEDGEAMADEYDSYLMSAFSAAANGRDVGAICELLRRAEVRMGREDGGIADRHMTVAVEILTMAGRPANR